MPARPASRRESAPSLLVRKRSGYSCPSVENERSRSAAANRLDMPGAELQLPGPACPPRRGDRKSTGGPPSRGGILDRPGQSREQLLQRGGRAGILPLRRQAEDLRQGQENLRREPER